MDGHLQLKYSSKNFIAEENDRILASELSKNYEYSSDKPIMVVNFSEPIVVLPLNIVWISSWRSPGVVRSVSVPVVERLSTWLGGNEARRGVVGAWAGKGKRWRAGTLQLVVLGRHGQGSPAGGSTVRTVQGYHLIGRRGERLRPRVVAVTCSLWNIIY